MRSAGVTVGQVDVDHARQELVPGPGHHGDQRRACSSRSTRRAKILTAGLLGDQYVGIEPGSDDKNLANGDLIKQTQSAVVLENLISQFLFNKAADAGASTPASAPGASLAPAPAASAAASGSKK